MIKKL
jgi:hypothetical protein